jgi:hypothetical protein
VKEGEPTDTRGVSCNIAEVVMEGTGQKRAVVVLASLDPEGGKRFHILDPDQANVLAGQLRVAAQMVTEMRERTSYAVHPDLAPEAEKPLGEQAEVASASIEAGVNGPGSKLAN